MTKLRRMCIVSLLAFGVLAARSATAQTCDYLVTCYSNLPESQYADPSWQYSHQCCDLYDHTTIWNVYIDLRNHWHLVSSNIQP